MKRHEQFDEMLARRSELTAAEEMRLQDHLLGCPDCRATAAAYAEQRLLLRAMPMADPPPVLRARVLQEVSRPQPAPGIRFRLPSPFVFMAPAAGVLAAAVLLIALLHRPQATAPTAVVHTFSTPAPLSNPYAYSGSKGGHPGTWKGAAQRPARHGKASRRSSGSGPTVPAAPPPGVSGGAQIALGAPPTAVPAPVQPVAPAPGGQGAAVPTPAPGPTQAPQPGLNPPLTGGGKPGALSQPRPTFPPRPTSPPPTSAPVPPTVQILAATPAPTSRPVVVVAGLTPAPINTPVPTVPAITKPVLGPIAPPVPPQPQPTPSPTP